MNRILLLTLFVLTGTAAAQTAPSPDSREAKLERARQLHDRAKAMNEEADRRYKAADVTCREKFFVNSCLDDARQAQMDETLKARKLDKQARELEREVKRQDVAEHEAKHARDVANRAAAAAARAEKNRRKVEEAERRLERKREKAAEQEGERR